MSFSLLRTVVAMALVTSVVGAESAEYVITELKAPGRGFMQPSKIIDDGSVLGMAFDDTSGLPHPCVYRRGVSKLLFSHDVIGNALDMNNSGEIICGLFVDSEFKPVYLSGDRSKVSVSLNDVFGAPFYPLGINDSGDMLGIGAGNIVYNHSSGTMRTVSADWRWNMVDINNDGQMVGYGSVNREEDSALLSMYGVLVDGSNITRFSVPGMRYTQPIVMNNLGQIAGRTMDDLEPLKHQEPFIFENGQFTMLGTLPGDLMAGPSGFNDRGEVVGYSGFRAFRYRNGSMADLNTLIPSGTGWNLDWATSINNKGQIVGLGRFRGRVQGFLLTPVGLGGK
jgi:probable HAF family extracellular repeat protein